MAAKLTAGFAFAMLVTVLTSLPAHAQVYNVKVVTDARPDYSDMDSMVRSITSKWQTPAEKNWALYYWGHMGRRQTTPMYLHGMEATDPIMQFNDYGYTQCSTISGIMCGTWNYMGYKCKFWDVAGHTVPEVEYDGAYHLYDASMSALYTLCDGKTIAGVEDMWKEVGCELSGGVKQKGHYAMYHCLCGTSIKGWLTGSDYIRTLESEGACFRNRSNPAGFYNQDGGHRYVLNLLPGSTYSRYFTRADGGDTPVPEDAKKYKNDPDAFVPNPMVKQFGSDPESENMDYRLRGTGIWSVRPDLTAAGYKKSIYSEKNIVPAKDGGLMPQKAGEAGEAVFELQSANVTASLAITASVETKSADDWARISVSTDGGRGWKEVWKSSQAGASEAKVKLRTEVSGAYQTLVKVELSAKSAPVDALLKKLELAAYTQVNSKTAPALNWGQNTVYVAAGEPTDSIVYWPDFAKEDWKKSAVDNQNLAMKGFDYGIGLLYPAKESEDGWVIFRADAPGDIKKIVYGGRFAVQDKNARIEMMHSFDEGKTWQKSWSLTEVAPDKMHYETISAIPAGTRSVMYKFLMNRTAGKNITASIYGLRMETEFAPVAAPALDPMEVTFTWQERQEDYSLVRRSHTQLVEKLPATYTINVGGVDHPVMESLVVNVKGARAATQPTTQVTYGYSDGKDVPAKKWIPQWQTVGKNYAVGKPYTVTPLSDPANGGADEKHKLTDGIVGPYAAASCGEGLLWDYNKNPVIDLDLGKAESCGVFRIHLTSGWPWWDALSGNLDAKIEVQTSTDGKTYASNGFFNLKLRKKDLPINVMVSDHESMGGYNFELALPKPVSARYVRYKITNSGRLAVTEVQVLDEIKYAPFDLRVALPSAPAN